LGAPFIIENREGAGGNIGPKRWCVRASPDGYTLLFVTSANAWNATLYANLNFNFIDDIVPRRWSHAPPAEKSARCDRSSLRRKSDHVSSGEAMLDVHGSGSGVRTSRDD
jgi:hypothetical protein